MLPIPIIPITKCYRRTLYSIPRGEVTSPFCDLLCNLDVPGPIPAPPTASISGKYVVSLSWNKPSYTGGSQIVAYKVESWLLGEGAMWTEVSIS